MVLLIERGDLDVAEVQRAVHATFAHRSRHTLPSELDAPPAGWAAEFPAMAREAGLSTTEINEAFATLTTFWRRVRTLHGGKEQLE
jgi:hypothetical protein